MRKACHCGRRRTRTEDHAPLMMYWESLMRVLHYGIGYPGCAQVLRAGADWSLMLNEPRSIDFQWRA